MKKEYNFAKAARGKFCKPNVVLNLPVYPDADVQSYLSKIAERKGTEFGKFVNALIRKEIELVKEMS